MQELKNALDAFDIELKNPKSYENRSESVISQEFLIRRLWDFLCSDYEKNVIFNPGSSFSYLNSNKSKDIYYFGEDIYLAVLMVFSALETIYKSAGKSENYIETMPIGTPVIYVDDPKDRFIYKGITEKNGFVGVILESTIDAHSSRFVPKKFWGSITKDNGTAKSGSRGRNGLRDFKKLNSFLQDCLKFDKSEIPCETEYSTIFVIDDKAKERARVIINNVSLSYKNAEGNKIVLSVSDLTNAAFYVAPNKPIYYPGNINKQEPAIKITSGLNIALELCSKKYREKQVSRIIVADSIIEKSKIAGILNLLSNNQKVIIETDYSFISRLNDVLDLTNFQERKIKSFIPDGALLLPENIQVKSPSLIMEIFKWQAEDIRNKTTDAYFFKTAFTDNDYAELKSLLFVIKRADVISENKDLYFMKAYYILKTLSASLLPVSNLNEDIDIIQSFDELKEIQLPKYGNLEESKKRCEELLQKLIDSRREDKERKDKLTELLLEENRKGKETSTKRTVLIIVHKKYLQLSLERYLLKLKFNNVIVKVETLGKIKNKNYYDLIICCGMISNDVLNIFTINFTEKAVLLCASYKESEFNISKKKALRIKRHWLKTSAFDLKIKDEMIEELKTEVIKNEEDFTDADFEELIKGIISNSNYIAPNNYKRQDVTVNTLALFDDDSCGFFTPEHKVNVLRQIEETAEYEVQSLQIEKVVEGDNIIFVERHGKMQDAISTIQNYLVEKEALPSFELEAIKITKKWREDLASYVRNKDKHETKKSIAEKCNISIVEFNNWLNFDFYIVGPDPKCITSIGKLINYDLMINDPVLFNSQVKIVNHLHTKIRRALGEAIIAKEEGKTPTGEYARKIFEEIGELENIRQVQEIKSISRKVEISLVNHPISY